MYTIVSCWIHDNIIKPSPYQLHIWHFVKGKCRQFVHQYLTDTPPNCGTRGNTNNPNLSSSQLIILFIDPTSSVSIRSSYIFRVISVYY